MKTCTIEDCTSKVEAKGYCIMHYKRYRKHGDALAQTRVSRGATVEDILRFSSWDVTADDCWEFKGRLEPDGYGVVTIKGAPYRAHRAAYELWIGPIPEGHVIRHTCDNRRCINPLHLITGSPRDNVHDAQERKRLANGERHGMHKLSDQDVDSIRYEYSLGDISQRALAAKYGCSQKQIGNILARKQRRNETHLIAA